MRYRCLKKLVDHSIILSVPFSVQFEAENAALSVMNPYIQEAFKKFR